MSGGQRARVALARAVYARADLYVIFSMQVMHVLDFIPGYSLTMFWLLLMPMLRGTYLVAYEFLWVPFLISNFCHLDNVIGPQGLLATKGRILVTNTITYLKYFDHVLYLRRGIILEHSTYSALMANPESEVRKLVYVLIF